MIVIPLLVIALAFSFLLSGLEAAVLAASILRARHRASAGSDARAEKIDAMLARRDCLLAAISVANASAGLGAFAMVATTLVKSTGDAGYGLAFALWLPVFLFVFELVPKELFRRFPYRALETFAPLLRMIDATLGRALQLGSPLVGLLKDGARKAEDDQREDFRHLTLAAGRYGALTSDEARLIHSVLDFQNLSVTDLMTPIDKVEAVGPDATADEWLTLAAEQHLEHLPMRSKDGRIDSRLDVLATLAKGAPAGAMPASDHAEAILEIPSYLAAVEALAQMRRSCHPVARVTEGPQTRGIISATTILQAAFQPSQLEGNQASD